MDGVARASGVRWYGHVLKRDNDDILRRALDFEVAKTRGRGDRTCGKDKCKDIPIRLD